MSFIQISKSNFFHNLSVVEKRVGGKDKIAVVVKDNAYGHGIEIISKLSQEYGIKKAIVRNIDEANTILEYFDEVIILNFSDGVVSDKISQVINHISDINNIAPLSKVELKIDTGMHRNGIMPDELQEALQKIKNKKLILNGVMTHFSSADVLDNSVFLQLQIFQDIKQDIEIFCNKQNIAMSLFHSCNSSSCFRLDDVQDFVRVGICIYGYIYTATGTYKPDLKPVMSLWANLISSRKLNKNDRVGYGGDGILDASNEIGTYDIGYSDGFFRLNSSHTYTTPNNSKILGRVSMDNLSATCTDERLCIFDDATMLAQIFNTITYDVLVKLNNSIKRIVV